MPSFQSIPPITQTLRAIILGATVLTISITGALVTQAQGAPSTEEKLDRVESKLEKEQGREEVLTTEIEKYDGQISAMEGEVSNLRQQESVAESELEQKQAELDEAIRELKVAVEQLEVQRQRLKRALNNLRENLVATYMAGTPDLASIALAAEDYGDLVATSEYLEAIQNQIF